MNNKHEPIRQQIETHGTLYAISSNNEKELMSKLKGKVSFYSLNLRKIEPNTVATVFIIRTAKPMRWIDFIKMFTKSFSDEL